MLKNNIYKKIKSILCLEINSIPMIQDIYTNTIGFYIEKLKNTQINGEMNHVHGIKTQ